MNELDPRSSITPWRAIWFRPNAAVGAVLARGSERGSWLLYTFGAMLGVVASMAFSAHLFAAGPTADAAKWTGVCAIAGALLGAVSYFIEGWLVAGVARVLGGRGPLSGFRVAMAWSAVPTFVSAALILVISLIVADKGSAVSPRAIVAGLVNLVGVLWFLTLATATIAKVASFGRVRAFLSVAVGVYVVAFVLAFGFRTLALQPFNIPSGSMVPNLLVGDYAFANKFAYGYGPYSPPYAAPWIHERILGQAPKRGDVVVFRTITGDYDFVKRIVGLPGDKIQLIQSELYINGVKAPRRRILPGYRMADPFGRETEVETYEEELPGGAKYRIIQLSGATGSASNTRVYETPPGTYFMLGDNRDNSEDSRFASGPVGFVPFENLIGRIDRIFYSLENDERSGRTVPRWERIGLAVP